MNRSGLWTGRLVDYAGCALLAFLALLLVVETTFSLQWRMEHDAPLLHYVAFLMDEHGYFPYRDLFGINLVGTYLFHLAIGTTVGYGDLAFRIVDVGWLGAITLITYLLLRRIGRTMAVTACLLFGLVYIGDGPATSLEREVIGVLPIALALLLAASSFARRHEGWTSILVGALFGCVSSIKPQLAIGLPAVVAYLDSCRSVGPSGSEARHRSIRLAAAAVGGFSAVVVALVLWLVSKGAAAGLWELLHEYMPLYLQLDGTHAVLDGSARWKHAVASYLRLGGLGGFLIPIVLGGYLALSEGRRGSAEIRLVRLLVAMLVLYSLVPVLSGQFWSYHWIPFVYFASMCAGLVFWPSAGRTVALHRKAVPLVALALLVLLEIRPAPDFPGQLVGRDPPLPKQGRVDEIAEFLQDRLRPGDTVQPLDWTGGAVHGMLIARARIATRFLYDHCFYHHVSRPYVRDLRTRFLRELAERPPRFVIEVDDTPRPKGPDTTTDFPELSSFLDSDYRLVHRGEGFAIREARNGAGPEDGD